ncbi:MAG: D-aminoacyl-tRNA deacylase [Halobacteriales archaeon]|nr:D-aminoacyl-tRNA deacylase [Halobacteriales archaeon]
MLGIVVSRADEASAHIGERLLAAADWTAHEDGGRPDGAGGGAYYRTEGAELREFDGLHIELERPADAFDGVDLIAFASRHSGETGPLLTGHHTGNLGPAEYGGEPDAFAAAAPAALSATVAAFETAAPEGYGIGIECTHHGPTDVGAPSLFVEVGSDEAQWRDAEAATAAARAILSLRGVDPRTDRAFVGLGGGHYAPRFTRIVRETDWSVGHIAADWGLRAAAELDDDLLRAAFERSGADLAVVDGDHPELVERVESLGVRVVGESWLRATAGVARPTIDRLETAVAGVDEGLRFGEPARRADGVSEFGLHEPAPELLADANGIDAGRVREAVAADAVAFETVESGNRVAGRVAAPDGEAWDRIESALVGLLRERFEEVAVERDAIVATEEAFDPDRARKLGVESGPAFGRLAAGQPVTVGGREIPPSAVHETRTVRYPR